MEDYGGAQRVFHVSLKMLFCTGLLFSLLLVVLAHWLVETVLPDARAYYSIIALAPAVFFVTFLASFRGYFQGWQIMTPTACSEITEQVVRVGTMIVFLPCSCLTVLLTPLPAPAWGREQALSAGSLF